MGGIAGIIDLKGTREIDRAMLARMTSRLEHRGPDGHGYHIEPGFGFGHRAKDSAIARPHMQPCVAANGRTVLSFDGTLTGQDLLRMEFSVENRARLTRDDHLTAEFIDLRGPDALLTLTGAFAFAAYSPREKTFLLARDRFGQRPLYYYQSANGFLFFASEIPALLESGAIPSIVDDTAIADYFFYGYIPDPKTIYHQIRKLPPAHYLSFRKGEKSPQLRRWWQPQFSTVTTSFDAANVQFRDYFSHAMRIQLSNTEHPVTFRQNNAQDHLLTEFLDKESSHLCVLSPEDLNGATLSPLEGLNLLTSLSGEPMGHPSMLSLAPFVPTLFQHTTDIYLSTGSNTIFAGTKRYLDALTHARIRTYIPGILRTNLLGSIGAYPPYGQITTSSHRLQMTLAAMRYDGPTALAQMMSPLGRTVFDKVISPTLSSYRPEEIVRSHLSKGTATDPVQQAQLLDLEMTLPNAHLLPLDHFRSVTGVQQHMPYLNEELVDWAMSLPRQCHLHDGQTKRLILGNMRTPPQSGAMSSYQPASWAHQQDEALMQLRNSDAWKDSGYCQVDNVLDMVEQHQKGQQNNTQALWSVLALNAFLEAPNLSDAQPLTGELALLGSS